jgi:hypothetical protein
MPERLAVAPLLEVMHLLEANANSCSSSTNTPSSTNAPTYCPTHKTSDAVSPPLPNSAG